MGRGGYGRGGRGAGRGRGRGRGGGGANFFPGVGQLLGTIGGSSSSSGVASDSSSGPARRPGRGGALAARGLNAVPLDYGTLRRPGASRSDVNTSMEASNSLESSQIASSSRPVPENVQRTPIVPPTPPTGPRQPARRMHRQVPEPAYPHYDTLRGTVYNSRPPEASGDALYLAATGSSRGGRAARGHFRRGDPADSAAHFQPVSFIKATGEWKDGQWTGKEPEQDGPSSSGQKTEGTQQRYDAINARRAGAGLGFSAPPAPVAKQENTYSDLPAEAEGSHAAIQTDEDDPMEALMKAFPGSRELNSGEDSGVLDEYINPEMPLFAQQNAAATAAATTNGKAPPPARFVSHTDPSTMSSSSLSSNAVAYHDADEQRDTQEASESEEDEILIPQQSSLRHSPAYRLNAQSDSEEDRQLDAIIAAGAVEQASSDVDDDDDSFSREDSIQPQGDSFVIDLTGTDSHGQEDVPIVQTGPAFVLGEEAPSQPLTAARAEQVDEIVMDTDAAVADSGGASRLYADVLDSTDEEDFVGLPRQAGSKKTKTTGRKARNAAKKARRRAKKAGLREGEGDDELDDKPHEHVLQPRTGDSDIEWGSDGPPDLGAAAAAKKAKRQQAIAANGGLDPDTFRLRDLSLHSHADTPRTPADEERMLREALALSVRQAGGRDSGAAAGVSYSSISVKGPRKKGMTRREREQEAILADYMENALRRQSSDEDEDEDVVDQGDEATLDRPTDMDAMIKFMQGMDPQQGGRQLTLGDIQDEIRMAEEDEWMTESEGDEELSGIARVVDEAYDEDSDVSAASEGDSDEVSNEDDSDDDVVFDKAERAELGEEVSDSDGEAMDDDDSDDSDSDDDEGAVPRNTRRGAVETDSDGSSSDDDTDEGERIFDRNFSWAAEDEEFINSIERFCQANEGILQGKDRAARNKLFKAIETGDFDGSGLAPASRKRGKKAQKTWAEGEIWAEELQSQWEKDRATKAANKRKRAAERQAAALSPFPNTHKKGTKKMAKKAARAARRTGRTRTENEEEEWDEPVLTEGLSQGATNLRSLDAQIHEFLDLDGHSTLSLPPMDKRSRAQVHMLAAAYSLTSKSRGAGRSRFITLIKNSKSGRNVDTRKVKRILGGHLAEASFGGGRNGKSGVGGKSRGAGPITFSRNVEGTDVGWGADKIGADNIGHKLLSMMGWAEGTGVGASQGMSEPIGAKVKTSKGGLGF